jgi:hypothetical protein
MKKITLIFISCAALVAGCSKHGTPPEKLINQKASMPAGLPFNPLDGKMITPFVDPKSSTMATLFGNDVAAKYATTQAGQDYPDGSELTLVTWGQQEDAHWFGARIPAEVKSVETVKKVGEYRYLKYSGTPMKAEADNSSAAERIKFITGLRAAVLP